MVTKTVLKVDISCKKKLLKAVSGLQGVDKVEVDGEKGILIVTGNADPYEIIVKTRKAGKFAEVVSIGPPPPPQKKPEEKKPEEKKTENKSKVQAQDQPFTFTYPTCPVTPLEQQSPLTHCSIL